MLIYEYLHMYTMVCDGIRRYANVYDGMQRYAINVYDGMRWYTEFVTICDLTLAQK